MPSARDPGPAAWRRYDAFADADRLGIEVEYMKLPQGLPSMLARQDKVVLLDEGLVDDSARNDELAHQLVHYRLLPRPGETAHQHEEAVLRCTARRLILVPDLIDAVNAVLEEDRRNGVSEVGSAARAAALLGTQTSVLWDRLMSFTPKEIASTGITQLMSLLTWPPTISTPRVCGQDTDPPATWFDRLRYLLSWAA